MASSELLETLTLNLGRAQNNVCAVDENGCVTWVNSAWRQFAFENSYEDEDCGIGQNYISISEHALGKNEIFSRNVARGLRSLLAGERLNVFGYYPCHAPRQHRWFSINAFRLHSEERRPERAAVIIHSDVTQMIEPHLLKIDDVDEYVLSHQII